MKHYSTTLNAMLKGETDIEVLMYAHAQITAKPRAKIGTCSNCSKCQPFKDSLQCETNGKLMSAITAKDSTCEYFKGVS